MVKPNLFFSLVVLFLVFSPLVFAQDEDFWGEYKFISPGHYKLVNVTHVATPNANSGANSGATLTSDVGSATGTSEIHAGGGFDGTSSGTVKWSEFPSTGKENETFPITVDMDATITGETMGVGVGATIDGHSGDCTTFDPNQYVSIIVPIAAAELHTYDKGETKKSETINYTFPYFYWPWSCMHDNSQAQSGSGSDMMRRESQVAGKYYIYLTVSDSTPGGSDVTTYTYEWVPGVENGGDLSGRITDGHGDPIPYANVSLGFQGNTYRALTDATGNYKIENIPGFTPDENNPPQGRLTAFLSYWRDGKHYYAIFDSTQNDTNVYLSKFFNLETESDKRQDIDFDIPVAHAVKSLPKAMSLNHDVYWLKTDDPKMSPGSTLLRSESILQDIDNFAAIYYYSANAIDFYLTILNASIDQGIPVDVKAGGNDGTYYSRSGVSISIDAKDMGYDSPYRPRNREYHEFSHFLMFEQWNQMTIRLDNDTNHGGFINSNTADSYTEGFAEFMACVIADYSNDPNDPKPADVYSIFGSFNDNFKPWNANGQDEELSVASTLWTIYKKEHIPIQKLYPVLVEKHTNFYEYTQALKAAFQEKSSDIDKILVDHGIFQDKFVGNKTYDDFEPYIDANNNSQYDQGEYFIDYGITATHPNITWDGVSQVGQATNYQRPNRGMAVTIPNAFVKSPAGGTGIMNVSVHYNDPSQGTDYSYTSEMKQGLVYVMPRPDDVQATITVVPKNGGNTYTITNSELLKKFYSTPKNQGYFDTFDFGPVQPEPKEIFQGIQPAWNTDRGTDVVDNRKGHYPSLDTSDLLGGCQSLCPISLGLLVLSVIFYRRR